MQPGIRVAGRYEVLSDLGQGAMSTVYVARDLKFGVEVALKVAPASRTSSYDEFRARFVREARIGYLLGRTEGFVRALDWGELPGGDLYLTSDLVRDAVPLDLRAGLRPVVERLAVFHRAASLVGRAHAQGIVHRDVKPGNFLVSGAGELFLTDFGLAKVVGDRSDEQEVVGYTLRTGRDAYLGTPQFMPPEQFENAAEVDALVDIYALGVMLFHALTGRYPFEGRSGVELLVRQLAVRDGKEPFPRVRDVDPRIDAGLDALCADAIALDPDRRLQSVDELLRRVVAAMEGKRPEERLPAASVAAMRQAHARARGAKRPRPPALESRELVLRSTAAPAPVTPLVTVDADGLTSTEALRDVQRKHGPEALRAALGDAPALRVEDERPLQGRVRYLGRVGLVRPRDPGRAQVVVGRTRQRADVVFDLPTISSGQVQLYERDGQWFATDEGSRNGTALNGVALTKDDPRPVRDGDVLHLSKHVTLVFHSPESLGSWLLQHVP
jgi:hypothetical protein